MNADLGVDADGLREEVRSKYREVAINPRGDFHFHTGRPLARRLGCDDAMVGDLPDTAVKSFAGVANLVQGSSRLRGRLVRRPAYSLSRG